jgi:hypothetical protein
MVENQDSKRQNKGRGTGGNKVSKAQKRMVELMGIEPTTS